MTQSILLDTNALLWILGGGLSVAGHLCQCSLELPPIHRDPFDRLLIAQARTEGMILAASASRIREYQVSTIW